MMSGGDIEEGECITDNESLESTHGEDKSDCDSEDSGDYVASTSLFDALAAAQEASEKYSGKKPQVDESHRLTDTFLCDAFTCAISKSWKKPEDGDVDDDGSDKVDWKVGDRCSALYEEDGIYYPARVVRVKDWKNATIVRFNDYGNEEEVLYSNMREIEKRETKKRKKRPAKKKRKVRVRNKSRESSAMVV